MEGQASHERIVCARFLWEVSLFYLNFCRLSVQNQTLLSYIPDYKINVIAPFEMSDKEINQFSTNLREVMLYLKYSKDKIKLFMIKEANRMSPALQTQPEIISLHQYEAFPEDKRVEVFDGIVYDMSSPSQIHQTILTELLVSLRSYIKRKNGNCSVFPAPFDVKLNDTPLTIVQPDLMIICDKEKLDGKRCNGAPDFIIEIVSPSNPSDDYIRKLYYYKNYGVREYWIVDPQRKSVMVNFFETDLLNVPYTFESVIKVNIYEDLYIDFAEISNMF